MLQHTYKMNSSLPFSRTTEATLPLSKVVWSTQALVTRKSSSTTVSYLQNQNMTFKPKQFISYLNSKFIHFFAPFLWFENDAPEKSAGLFHFEG